MSAAWDSSHGPARAWRSGPWSLELRDDEFADVAFEGQVVLRAVRAVVRDRDWNTADLVVDRVDESIVALTLHVRSDGYGSSLRGVVRAEVHPTFLRFEMDAESGQDFETNRTGLVVLQPPSLAGAALTVTHSDGSAEASGFPAAISAHQPVFDIAGLSWSGDGLEVQVRFAGEVFEMEDQRNWTDASYKTYSRPLAEPFPYRIAAGERIVQWVDVAVRRVGEPAARSDADVIELREGGTFPQVLLGASTAPDPGPADLAPVGDALLVELDLATPNWRAALERAASRGLALDVRMVFDADAETIVEAVGALAGRDLVRVAAFDPVSHVSDARTVAALRAALRDAGIDVPVVGGARSHFTELNREQSGLGDDLDGVTFSITPLFHAASTEQLVESVAMQRLVAQQAVSIADGAPVHVGPVTLRPRFNNVATTSLAGPGHPDLSAGYGPALLGADDPRHDAPELAAWTAASAAALAVPGVASIVYFEEWGPRGIRDDAGADRPVAAAVGDLASLSGRPLMWGSSPDGLVWAVGGGDVVLVSNLDRRARTLTVRQRDRAHTIEVAALGTAQLDVL